MAYSTRYVIQYKPFDDIDWIDYGYKTYYSAEVAERSLRNPRSRAEVELGAAYRIVERVTTDTVVKVVE